MNLQLAPLCPIVLSRPERSLIGSLFQPLRVSQWRLVAAFLLSLAGAMPLCAQVPVVTYTRPTLGTNVNFGSAVAVLGNGRVFIGAYRDNIGASGTGAAYLFATNGTALVTVTNPTPAANDHFGISVAVVGTDRLLVGANADSINGTFAGAAYLFNTNGTLLATFTNTVPSPNANLGTSVAAVGTNRVLVGAQGYSAAVSSAGAAFLFNTNGTLLNIITNPTPSAFENFGYAVAALGNDRIIIGAPNASTGVDAPGEAYLYNTNGTLLATFSKPNPVDFDSFGTAVAGLGTDRVIVGANRNDAGASDAGIAYLFSTNGALVMTFTNPAPTSSDFFGGTVAAMGTDRVLVGATGDPAGVSGAGTAYLFSTNGSLVYTFTNPTPASFESFSYAMAASGTDRVFISALNENTGATGAGAVYLYDISIARPLLQIFQTNAVTAILAWPTSATGFALQQNTNFLTATWTNATNAVVVVGPENQAAVSITSTNRFYRLVHP